MQNKNEKRVVRETGSQNK